MLTGIRARSPSSISCDRGGSLSSFWPASCSGAFTDARMRRELGAASSMTTCCRTCWWVEIERGEPGQWVEVPMFDAVLSTYNIAVNELLDPPDDRVMNPIYDAGRLGAIATAGSVQHVWALISATHSDLVDPAPIESDIPTKARLRPLGLSRRL